MPMRNVVRIETREKSSEQVVKSKRHDYANGGFRLQETIIRTTNHSIIAVLDCGHIREQVTGKNYSKAKRLACYQCDIAERSGENA